MNINSLLQKMIEKNSSDLIIKVGSPPLFRTYGTLSENDGSKALTNTDTENYVKSILNQEQFKMFHKRLEIDFIYKTEDGYRFRANVFKQRGSFGMVLRSIPKTIPAIEELGLPDIARDFAMRPRGLLLVTGPASCGKSTTLASLVEHRNKEEECHIITVEDPVEFVYKDKKALINQRQVGRDTNGFSEALKHIMRQDPDVIVIGDMRDLETIQLAITAAETGHLVIANLHTTGAVSTIDRIIDVFPHYQQQQVRMQVSVNLIGIISQLLIKKKDPGMVAAYEIMVASTAVRNTIRENKTFQLPQLLDTQMKQGMRSLNKSLSDLVKEKVVEPEEVLSIANDPDELKKILPPKVFSKQL